MGRKDREEDLPERKAKPEMCSSHSAAQRWWDHNSWKEMEVMILAARSWFLSQDSDKKKRQRTGCDQTHFWGGGSQTQSLNSCRSPPTFCWSSVSPTTSPLLSEARQQWYLVMFVLQINRKQERKEPRQGIQRASVFSLIASFFQRESFIQPVSRLQQEQTPLDWQVSMAGGSVEEAGPLQVSWWELGVASDSCWCENYCLKYLCIGWPFQQEKRMTGQRKSYAWAPFSSGARGLWFALQK